MTKRRNRPLGLRTAAIHAGEFVDPVMEASAPNLVKSATFAPEKVTGLSARDEAGYEGFVYARLSNPAVKQLKDKLAAFEGAESCQCYASGMAAT
jgi:O-acetylhomoserine/O-acetylserine sulfhydrylase-like pyridoxal-dependent enzyme